MRSSARVKSEGGREGVPSESVFPFSKVTKHYFDAH
jgi:hypothetical protein